MNLVTTRHMPEPGNKTPDLTLSPRKHFLPVPWGTTCLGFYMRLILAPFLEHSWNLSAADFIPSGRNGLTKNGG